MPPEESPPQSAPESPTPVIEAPASAAEPVTPSETPPAPAEAVPAPETGPQGPLPVSKTDDRQETQVAQTPTPTAQIPPNEPLPPEPEPIQPPSAAAPVQTGILHSAREFLGKARIAIQDRKRKKRDKIMQLLTTKIKITNDEVEKLLHVSDATATRYLSALEKEGKIRQVGKTGQGVVYQKI